MTVRCKVVAVVSDPAGQPTPRTMAGLYEARHLAGACTACGVLSRGVDQPRGPYGKWGCRAFGMAVAEGGLCLPSKSVKQRVFTVEDWQLGHDLYARELRALRRNGCIGLLAEMQAGRRAYDIIKLVAFRRLGLAPGCSRQEIMAMF